jgi:hypothetical protein
METFKSDSILTLVQTESEFKGSPFTVKSVETGKDYTFKLVKSLFNDQHYLNVYVETQYMVFKHLGVYKKGRVLKKGKGVDTPSSKAIEWILRNLEMKRFDIVESSVIFTHLGKCIRCGRTLTDFESIQSGLGPICINR